MECLEGAELHKAVADKEKQRPLWAADPRLQQVTLGGNTILHLAVNYGEKEVAGQILDLDQSLFYKTNDKGDTPLHIAARLGDYEMAKLLIGKMEKQDVEHGTKHLTIENEDDGKDTTLHVAVRNGHVDMVKFLIKKYPSLALKTNKENESPLFMAVDREYYNIACEILKLREYSTKGRHMMNALHAAVIRTNKCKSTSLNTETNILFFNLYLLVFLTNTSRFKSFFPIIELLKKKKGTKLKKIFCSKRENKLGIEKLETMLRKSMRTNKSFH